MNEARYGPSTPDAETSRFRLRWFVTGTTPRSCNAIEILRRVCAEHLQGVCLLEGIDIYQQSDLAREAQVLATPRLVKYTPAPRMIQVGDLSRTEGVLSGLGLSA
jgi:hypothetical protein